MAKDLSEGVGGQIIALINEGYSQREVAAKVGVSKGGVQRTVHRFRKTQSYSSLPKSGRPRSTTLQEDFFAIEEQLPVTFNHQLTPSEKKQSAKQQSEGAISCKWPQRKSRMLQTVVAFNK